MAALTADQLYAIARQVGFNADEARIMTAIALRESSGDPMAHNPNRSTGDNSYGLWQINMIDSLGPARRAAFGLTSDADLFDPITNARAAFQLYKSSGYRPWSTDPNNMGGGRVPISAEKQAAAAAAAARYEAKAGSANGPVSDAELRHALGLPTTGVGSSTPGVYTPSSSGGSGGGGVFDAPPDVASMSDDELKAYVASHYGYAATWLDHPEVGPILLQAAREGWDTARLQGALSATTWWKTTSDTAREWDNKLATDPAAAQQLLDQRMADLGAQAQALGLSLDDTRLRQIATDSLRYAWDTQQLHNALSSELHYSPEQAAKGQIGGNVAAIKAMAASYMTPIGDQAAFAWAQQLYAGTMTEDGLKAQFGAWAKSRFPTLAGVIDAGITPNDYFDTYRQQIAQTLEIAPDAVDLLNDSRFQPVIDHIAPGEDVSKRRPMTLSETQMYLRGLPEWDKTTQARTSASDLAAYLGQVFGKVK